MKKSHTMNAFRFVFYSFIGIFMFFIPVEMNGTSSIPLDHVVTLIRQIPYFEVVFGSFVIIVGTVLPFIRNTWKQDKVTMILSIIQILALPFLAFYLFQIGPSALLADDMIPFIFQKIVVPVTTIIPVGTLFLAFIVSYGLMEFIGVLMRPVMVPVFKTPGRSAVDAITSFIGSYSVALILTNRMYREGRYTAKESAIIATGFSTVSASFMVIVAQTAGLMDQWILYFITTVFVTFVVTILTIRLYPLNKFTEEYFEGKPGVVEQDVKGDRLKNAWKEAMEISDQAPSLIQNIIPNLRDGIMTSLKIAPSLMSIGVIALIVANYTPFFDILGYIFYPITWLLRLPEPMLAAKAASLSIAEMFLPSLLVVDAAPAVQYVIAIVCISEILFFSASIPCMMSTDIPLKFTDYLIIWFERVALSLLLATPIVYLLFL